MANRMVLTSGAFGLTQYTGDDIILVGGTRTGKPGTDGTARLRYFIYDSALIEAGTPAERAQVGTTEINIRLDGDIEGMVDLAIAKPMRGQGIGRRVVEAVAATSQEGLRIYDIKKSALGFWRKMGCEIPPARRGMQTDGVMPIPPSSEPDADQPGPRIG